MGKMMPLKWIEQAEAREVCVIALSEAAVPPEPPDTAAEERAPSDQPLAPSDDGGPPAGADETRSSEADTAVPAGIATGPDGMPHRRRRRRRRRRPPHLDAPGAEHPAAGTPEGAAAAEGTPGDTGATEKSSEEGGSQRQVLRLRNWRRHRRARPVPRLGSAEAGGGTPAEAGARAGVGGGRDQRVGQARTEEARPGVARTDERRERDRRNSAGREDRRGERSGGQREGGRRGPPGRGRGAPDRRPSPKLYSFDSVVDRGFDDVEEEGETRRVHWTILKRTTADQISRKPIRSEERRVGTHC